MRQAINNLQSTHSGFGFVSQDHVFKICDQPHPIVVRQMIKECQAGDIDGSLARIGALWDKGYSAVDIVTTVFRVVKGMEELPEYTKLEYIRVSHNSRIQLMAGNWMDAYANIRGSRNSSPARSNDFKIV